MSFTAGDDAQSAQTVTTSDHAQVAHLELETVYNFGRSYVQLNRIRTLDQWIRITNCSTIVRYHKRDSVESNTRLPYSAELILQIKRTGKTTKQFRDETTLFLVGSTQSRRNCDDKIVPTFLEC